MASRSTLTLDPLAALATQFRHQMEASGLTDQSLANELHMDIGNVHRMLDPDEPSQPLSKMRAADHLNFDAVHVAVVMLRDWIDRKLAGAIAADSDRKVLERIKEKLERELPWHNPFDARGNQQRLAFRAMRQRAGVTQRALATACAEQAKESATDVAHRIGSFERGRYNPDSRELFLWITLLYLRSPEFRGTEISLRLLEEQGRKFMTVHAVHCTAERDPVQARNATVHPARKDGYSVELKTSPTVHGAVHVDFIVARQPERAQRSILRIVSARHDGYEIGVIAKGDVLLTLCRRRFDPESENEIPEFEVGLKDVVHHQRYGPGHVIAFPSGLWHRVEFLARETRIVTVNLTRSVHLGRRFRRHSVHGWDAEILPVR